MPTKVQVCQMTLNFLKQSKRISQDDLDDNTLLQAQVINDFWMIALTTMAESNAWPELRVIASLGDEVEEDPNDEWAFSYAWPGGCVKPLEIVDGARDHSRVTPPIPFEIGTDSTQALVYTDEEDATLKYIGMCADKEISGITKASPGVVTTTDAHNLATGDQVGFKVLGMVELDYNSNARTLYTVTRLSATTFSLLTLAGVAVNTTNYTTFTAGGVYLTIDNVHKSFVSARFTLALSLLLASLIAPVLTGGDTAKLGLQAMQLYEREVSKAIALGYNSKVRDEPMESEAIEGRG